MTATPVSVANTTNPNEELLGGALDALSGLVGLGTTKSRRAADEKQIVQKWGKVNPAIICSQCQTTGQVRTLSVKRKKGISGGKVMGARFT